MRAQAGRAQFGGWLLVLVVLLIANSLLRGLASLVLGPGSTGEHGGPPPGAVTVNASGNRFPVAWIRDYQRRQGGNLDGDYSISWTLDGVSHAAETAPGMDREQHFVNAFLTGHAPFPVSDFIAPWHLLARRKSYFSDRRLHGAPEIWQTSQQAWNIPRGDCEDHALLLADWLIESGFDARVVLGSYNGGGHAWVVVNEGGRSYLLEATDKRPQRWRHLPLAQLHSGYRPQLMFNREAFWLNTGPVLSNDYAGSHWALQSRYAPG